MAVLPGIRLPQWPPWLPTPLPPRLADHEALGKMLRREAGKLKLTEAQEKIGVADGAKWIRRQFRVRLPMMPEQTAALVCR